MYTASPGLEEKFDAAILDFRSFLTALKAPGRSQSYARKTIAQYVAAFEGNFAAWMGAAAVSAKSHEAKRLVEENLTDELRDNHADLLRDFAKAAGAEPSIEDYHSVEPAVSKVRNLIAEMSGLKTLTLIAVLEATFATEDVPFLEGLAGKLWVTNHPYTRLHAAVDIKHAEQLRSALGEERKYYPPLTQSSETINNVIGFTLDFQKAVYS